MFVATSHRVRFGLGGLLLAAALLASSGCTSRTSALLASQSECAAWGQPPGPTPLLLESRAGPDEIEAWGSATPLADGSLVTARHVFNPFPTEINGERIRSIDVLGRGVTPHASLGVRVEDGGVFAGDWMHLRVQPHDADQGWVAADRRLTFSPGQPIVVRGYRASSEDRATPELSEVRLRVREAPSWVDASERSLIFAEPDQRYVGVTNGMSGGPVLIHCDESGEMLVGIFLGRVARRVVFVNSELYVIQPWPPSDE